MFQHFCNTPAIHGGRSGLLRKSACRNGRPQAACYENLSVGGPLGPNCTSNGRPQAACYENLSVGGPLGLNINTENLPVGGPLGPNINTKYPYENLPVEMVARKRPPTKICL
jgi:hypothetical protein